MDSCSTSQHRSRADWSIVGSLNRADFFHAPSLGALLDNAGWMDSMGGRELVCETFGRDRLGELTLPGYKSHGWRGVLKKIKKWMSYLIQANSYLNWWLGWNLKIKLIFMNWVQNFAYSQLEANISQWILILWISRQLNRLTDFPPLSSLSSLVDSVGRFLDRISYDGFIPHYH